TFGKPGRDPRGWVVSVAFYGLVHRDSQEVRAADDARQVGWFPVEELPPLAFDHADILATGLRRLRLEARLRPIGLEVLSAPFTFTELVVLYEAVRGSAKLPVDRLCGRLLDWGVLLEVGSRHGIALHRFDEEKYRRRLHERQEGSVP
ncbi:MAG: NUDIX hydrolase, partial [Saprospiraceae bacterium]|nr:NUDIX hydrolase [Saprospiraceae bacterium]